MGKVVKYFMIALAAAGTALGIYHVVRSRQIENDCLGEGETYEDPEPCGCCGAEFSPEAPLEKSAEEPSEAPAEESRK